MKKEKIKGFVCGMVAGITAISVIPVMAQQVEKNILASYRNIKIYADGKLVNTNEDNEAFIHNGTTYLPVRAIGETFNKAVEWEGATSSVYIGTRPATVATPSVMLNDLEYFTRTLSVDDNLSSYGRDNIGNTHSTVQYYGGGNIEYLLNGRYRRISGTVGLADRDKDTSYTKVLKIYGDNKLLYTSPEIKGGVVPDSFNIDITGVINLRIEVDGAWVCLYDAALYA